MQYYYNIFHLKLQNISSINILFVTQFQVHSNGIVLRKVYEHNVSGMVA